MLSFDDLVKSRNFQVAKLGLSSIFMSGTFIAFLIFSPGYGLDIREWKKPGEIFWCSFCRYRQTALNHLAEAQ